MRLSEAARRLLGRVRGGEERVYGVIAPPPDAPAGLSRSVDVKRVYRKLGVDSRVGLTRLLLRPRESEHTL